MSKIRGKFEYKKNKDKKKKNDKEMYIKLQKKMDKKLMKQCECNHLDSKHNKGHWKTVTVKDANGNEIPMYRECKICGGRIYAKPNQFLTKEALESANMTIYTAWSLLRNKYQFKQIFDKDITTSLLMNARVGTLIDKLKDADVAKNKKKGNKKNKKNDKKKGNNGYRFSY